MKNNLNREMRYETGTRSGGNDQRGGSYYDIAFCPGTRIVDRMSPHDAYGIVTYVNILHAIYQEDGDMDLLNVYDIATKPLIQIVPQLDIKYAAQLMVKHNRTRLSVTWEGRIVGLITMSDIANVLIAEAMKEG